MPAGLRSVTHLQTGDVSVAEIFAKLLDLLQLQEVYPQHLYGDDHQVVHLLVTREERLLVFLLMLKMLYMKETLEPVRHLHLHKGLHVDVEGVRAGAVRGLSGQLALLKQEGKQREQRVPGRRLSVQETTR